MSEHQRSTSSAAQTEGTPDLEEALLSYSTAFQLSPGWSPAYLNFGITSLNLVVGAKTANHQQRMQRWHDAEAALKRAAALDMVDGDPYFYLGTAYEIAQHKKLAKQAFLKALELNPVSAAIAAKVATFTTADSANKNEL